MTMNAGKYLRKTLKNKSQISYLAFRCSEKDIDFKAFRELLPSRCTLGESFCEGTCNAIGRKSGSCEYGEGCECSDEFLSPSEFALCAAESTCRLDCQANGKATGECKGWKCECQSTLTEDLDESLIRDLSELTEVEQ